MSSQVPVSIVWREWEIYESTENAVSNYESPSMMWSVCVYTMFLNHILLPCCSVTLVQCFRPKTFGSLCGIRKGLNICVDVEYFIIIYARDIGSKRYLDYLILMYLAVFSCIHNIKFKRTKMESHSSPAGTYKSYLICIDLFELFDRIDLHSEIFLLTS